MLNSNNKNNKLKSKNDLVKHQQWQDSWKNAWKGDYRYQSEEERKNAEEVDKNNKLNKIKTMKDKLWFFTKKGRKKHNKKNDEERAQRFESSLYKICEEIESGKKTSKDVVLSMVKRFITACIIVALIVYLIRC